MSNQNPLSERMQRHLDGLTKPVGSLGDLESYAVKLATIQGKVPPEVNRKATYVFAGDHGIAAEGVSLYPSEVTYQMVLNFASGGAAVNVLARHCGFDVFVVDAGVATPIDNSTVIDLNVARGTKNFAREPAMSQEEYDTCVRRGRELAADAVAKGFDLVCVGDMGIGNTTTAAALLIAAGLAADEVIDRGTGIDDAMLEHKREVILRAVETHAPYGDPSAIMRCVGGFELCMMSAFILGLQGSGVACVLDGFPATAAAYIAWLMDSSISESVFAGHKSKVKGHATALASMGLDPIVDLKMRLGEGTGAILGGFLVSLAAKIACEMASFESANVSRSEGVEQNY